MRRNRRPKEETAERLARVRDFFRDHHARVEPDASFATRVAARLPVGSDDLLGRVSLRLLPAAWVLAAVLTWLVLQPPPGAGPTDATSPAPSEDVLSWLLEDEDNEVLP